MFDQISPTYDLLNRVLSFGIDRRWRKEACREGLARTRSAEPLKIVDVACGTGDMLLAWKEAEGNSDKEVNRFLGVDPAKGMLEIGREKVAFADFIQGSATDLPAEAEGAHIVSISYGIRNVVELDEAFRTFYNTLAPGGLLVILEFTRARKKTLVQKAGELYMKTLLPLIGRLVSKHGEAYTYLPDSIDAFLSNKEMEEKMEKAGFAVELVKGQHFNVSTLFIGRKPE